MSHKSVIIQENKGQDIPEPYLQLVLKSYKSCVGFAFVKDNVVHSITQEGSPTPESIVDTEKDPEVKDKGVVWSFGNYPSGFSPDDIQPFDLIKNENDQPILVAFIEGNFPAYVQTDSSRSAEFFVAEELRSELLPLFESLDNDMEKFMDALRDPVLRKRMIRKWQGRGTIVLVSSTREIMQWHEPNDAKRREWIWGWTSDHLGFEEKEYPITKEEPKSQSLLASKQPATITAATDTAVKPRDNYERVLKAPPKELTSGKKIKNWYRHNEEHGSIPQNWPTKPEVWCKAKPTMESFQKDVSIKHIASTEPIRQPTEAVGGESDPIPIIPAEGKTAVLKLLEGNLFKKALDKNSQEMAMSPEEIVKVEEKIPTFVEVFKIAGIKGLEDTFTWSKKQLHALNQASPDALERLAMDYRIAYLKTLETPKKQVVSKDLVEKQEEPKSQSLLTKRAHNM